MHRWQRLFRAPLVGFACLFGCEVLPPLGERPQVDNLDPEPSDRLVTTPLVVDAHSTINNLGPVLDYRFNADQTWLAMIAPEPGETRLGALSVGPPGELAQVATGVARGLAGCEVQPHTTIFARAGNNDPAMLDLWVADGTTLHEVELPGHVLDRVLGASPDCRWAVVITRAGGLPVIAAVEVTGQTVVVLLANHNLSYSPGHRPSGFTPPPTYPTQLVWDDDTRFHYRAAEGPVDLAIAQIEVTP